MEIQEQIDDADSLKTKDDEHVARITVTIVAAFPIGF
jgi:hypothetical protein